MIQINEEWKESLAKTMLLGQESSPRGKLIKERIGAQIKISMSDPILTLAKRQVNYRFAMGEAAWILSGSNSLADIEKYMKRYANFSDDGITLNGAYGPKFVDQMSWAANQIANDLDTRQAVISLWRERPGPSKDIPCTLSLQFFVRHGFLHSVITMRSNDLVHGFTYDSFTFSMMTKTIQELLAAKGIVVLLGDLTINQGSAHVYEEHWKLAREVISEKALDPKWTESKVALTDWMKPFGGRHVLVEFLKDAAEEFRA